MQPWGPFGGDDIGIGYWQELYAVRTRTGHEFDDVCPGRAAADTARDGVRPQRSSRASGGPSRRSSGSPRPGKGLLCPGNVPRHGAADFPTAWPMIIVQVIGPVLMAIGLLVRPIALLMLVLTLRAQFSGAAQDEHLFWAALFGWYVVHGPASLSLDRLLSNGMKHSPLPLAALAIAAGALVQPCDRPALCARNTALVGRCPRRARPTPYHAPGHARRHAARRGCLLSLLSCWLWAWLRLSWRPFCLWRDPVWRWPGQVTA